LALERVFPWSDELLEHVPEKHALGLDPMETGIPKRTCDNKEIQSTSRST
jgi:hypothetical protein